MTKLFVSLLLFVLVHSSSSFNVIPLSGSELSNADKAAVIQLSIELIIEQKARLENQGKGHPVDLSEFAIISDENMSPALLPRIPGFRFRLMKEREVQRRAQRPETFRYVRVGEFSGNENGLGFSLALIERRGGLPYHSRVFKYTFRKSADKWQGKIHLIIC